MSRSIQEILFFVDQAEQNILMLEQSLPEPFRGHPNLRQAKLCLEQAQVDDEQVSRILNGRLEILGDGSQYYH